MSDPKRELHRDDWSAEVTTASPDALRDWTRTVLSLCAHRADAGEHLARALEADAELVPALCLRGFALLFKGRRALRAVARMIARETRGLAEKRGASARELHLIDALDAWASDRADEALGHFSAILAACPTDLFTLKLQHGCYFMFGRQQAMRASLEGVLPEWHERALPGYGYALGCHAFALEETGAFAQAEQVGREATRLEPSDAWGIHAVAHVMEMQDRCEEGIRWLRAHESGYAACAVFRGHVYWHRALLHCELGEYSEALALYDDEVHRPWVGDYRDMSNATSLLWRLEADGVDVGGRWRELAQVARDECEDHGSAFADAHYLLALCRGSEGECERLAASLRRYVDALPPEQGSQARVVAEVGEPLCRALRATERGEDAVEQLARLREKVLRIGGSNAQRDLFELFYIDAALAAGSPLARVALEARLQRRPHNQWARARLARTGTTAPAAQGVW